MLPSFSYRRAKSVNDAIKTLTAPGAVLHAGGTDLLGCLRAQAMKADTLVSLTGIPALTGIAAIPTGGLRIGAMTTLTEVAASKLVKDGYPALAQAAAAVASPQLRNQGTIGGNLCQRPRCWYFRGDFKCFRKGGDTCFAPQGENQYHAIFGGSSCFMVHPSDTATALVALGARVRIAGPGGTRIVPLASFFVLPDKNVKKENVLEHNEVVTEVLVPAQAAGTRSVFRKVRSRGSWDFALASAAIVLAFDADGAVKTASVVLGAAAPVPWRARDAEKVLVGAKLNPETAKRAAEAAVKGAQTLGKNDYKVALLRGIVEEQLLGLQS